jgi:hypothetical protein
MDKTGLILVDRFGVRTQSGPVRKKMGQPELRTEPELTVRFGGSGFELGSELNHSNFNFSPPQTTAVYK